MERAKRPITYSLSSLQETQPFIELRAQARRRHAARSAARGIVLGVVLGSACWVALWLLLRPLVGTLFQ